MYQGWRKSTVCALLFDLNGHAAIRDTFNVICLAFSRAFVVTVVSGAGRQLGPSSPLPPTLKKKRNKRNKERKTHALSVVSIYDTDGRFVDINISSLYCLIFYLVSFPTDSISTRRWWFGSLSWLFFLPFRVDWCKTSRKNKRIRSIWTGWRTWQGRLNKNNFDGDARVGGRQEEQQIERVDVDRLRSSEN